MPRELIKLVSTAGTGHFYTTTKTTKGVSTGKLEMKKFDPKARKHVNYRESKMK